MMCEDFPCCGHESGDCNGSLYGSDESIIAGVQRAWDEGHGYCDHEAGIYECPDADEEGDEDEEITHSTAQAPVLTAMLEYAWAIRHDWSDFDGRSEKLIIDDWVEELRQPDPSRDIEWHRRNLGICMAGGGHWCGRGGYCDDECGCVPCAEDRSER